MSSAVEPVSIEENKNGFEEIWEEKQSMKRTESDYESSVSETEDEADDDDAEDNNNNNKIELGPQFTLKAQIEKDKVQIFLSNF